ncbi:MAG TPA: MFS transporter [Candidatus Scatomorpha intestinavium]|uniref:MFS transporter n=1 Tax=Candidatus Scatomorpha intestinavium TaxID=2840922 RepID=A0A9D0ZFH0_9FIRM|nr:MFS transporter [Candidatus Scatomorpha intestinavium]
MSMKKYYPTAFALYMTYFVLGVASSIMSHYKQELAALWGSAMLADGTYDVSGVLAVIAALGLGRLITYPFAGPISDRYGRRVPALIGCACYLVFFGAVCFTRSYVLAYILGIVAGAANGFLDVSITPSCMEIFREKGTIANIFTKLSISIAQFLLPFAIGYVAAANLPFSTIFIVCAVLIAVVGAAIVFLPFPPYERAAKAAGGKKKERMKFTPSAVILIVLGFTTSTTFMIWLNCYQELAISYGIADPSRVQSLYSIGIVLALFVNAALLARGLKPSKILIIYPAVSVVTLVAVLLVQQPWICYPAGFLMGFFAAGGVLQLVTSVAVEMFPKNRAVMTSIVMIASSIANYAVLSIAGLLTSIGGADGPRLIMLFNIAVTVIGVALAVVLNARFDKDFQRETVNN